MPVAKKKAPKKTGKSAVVAKTKRAMMARGMPAAAAQKAGERAARRAK